MPHTNPYYLAGPFSAASALLATASARLDGRSPRPEARASLIADLVAAGLSAAAALQVQKFAEELNAPPPDHQPDRSLFHLLETLLQRSQAVLASELGTDQVEAFAFGAALCLTHSAALGRWDSASEKRTVLLGELTRARSSAHTLGVGEAEITALLSAAEAPYCLPTLLVPDVVRTAEVVLNALLRR